MKLRVGLLVGVGVLGAMGVRAVASQTVPTAVYEPASVVVSVRARPAPCAITGDLVGDANPADIYKIACP